MVENERLDEREHVQREKTEKKERREFPSQKGRERERGEGEGRSKRKGQREQE